MRKLIFAGIALACAAQSALAAAGDDPIHDLIQQFLNDVWGGLDFSQPQFDEIVASNDAEPLKSLKDCDLKEVTRTAGDSIAIVHFTCGEAQRVASVMLSFEDGMIAKIDVVSFVQVDAN